MDLGSLIMMVCLLGTASCSSDDKKSCPCPEVPPQKLTQPPPEKCFDDGDQFRYTCVEGYVRKAGSSNLIKCQRHGGGLSWSPYKLVCIPDPRRKLPTTTVTTTSTSQPPTDSRSIPLSETTETNPVVLTSTHLDDSEVYAQTTTLQTTARTEPAASTSNNTDSSKSTANPLSVSADHRNTAVAIICPSLVIICSLVGLFCWYKRRTTRTRNVSQQTSEEQVPMHLASA